MIRPLSTFIKRARLISIRLLVGRWPKNSCMCVPRSVSKFATCGGSTTVASTVSSKSGKVVNSAAYEASMAARPLAGAMTQRGDPARRRRSHHERDREGRDKADGVDLPRHAPAEQSGSREVELCGPAVEGLDGHRSRRYAQSSELDVRTSEGRDRQKVGQRKEQEAAEDAPGPMPEHAREGDHDNDQ